ncbi:MAG: HypC/HybG/HupF family hydrogenase formation chaperone [Marinilabiliales bacterium]|nr:MAG: HypC/HybG/HupF family hydrogenase formation chaperone [Marinilabiliales bacterium]
MCLSIPAKVEEINGEMAICSVGKSKYEASLQMIEFENVEIGDYVLIHTGFAIQKLDAEEAEASLKTFDEFKELNNALDEEEKQDGQRIV